MSLRVVESGCRHVHCPCGCGTSCEQHDGTLHFGNDGGAFFRALLMQEAGGDPNVSLSITATAPAGAADARAWLIALHGNREGARIEDSANSPIAIDPTFPSRHITREELLQVPGAADFHFACFDALVAQHSRIPAFLLGG